MADPPPAWTWPVARLSNAVHNDISPHLLFPISHEPSNSTSAGPSASSARSTAAQHQPAALEALLGALSSVDLSYLKPITPASIEPYVPPPGTLQAALVAQDPQLFALNVPKPPVANSRASNAPSAAAKHQDPPKQQQQQQQKQPAAVAEPAATPASSLNKRLSLARRPSDDEAGTSTAQVLRIKRRKRQDADGEEQHLQYVPKGLDIAQVKDATAKALTAFLQHVRGHGGSDSDEAEPTEEDAEDGNANVIPLSKQQVQSLCKQLAQAKAAGAVAQLEVGQLRELLQWLMPQIARGAITVADNDEKDAPAVAASLLALEAAACSLQILSAPGLPSELYQQELLDACLATIKFQLQYNVLVFHDLRYRRLYRQGSLQGDSAAQPAKKGGSAVKAASAAATRAPSCAAALRSAVEQCLSLLSEVVANVQVEVETLLPLLRVALGALNVQCVPVLQIQATALAVAVFRHYPSLRSTIMDEFATTVLSDMGAHAGRSPPRPCLVAEEGPVHIQTAVALVLQLLEAAAELPAVDADPSKVAGCFSASIAWADRLWAAVFERLPSARAQKSDTSVDFKAVVEDMVTDMLNVQMLPEWPSASTALRRFLKALCGDRGMKHADNAVKLMCIDFAGQLAGRLCTEALWCESETPWVDGALSEAGSPAGEQFNTATLLQRLLLEALQRFPSPHAASARRYMVCRMLYESLQEQQKGQKGEQSAEAATALLVAHRQLHDRQQSSLGASSSGAVLELDVPQASRLVRRLLMDGFLGFARTQLLVLLADAGDRSRQDANAAQVRAKAVKALAGVVECDPRVLTMKDVHAGVCNALMDESVSVREAALDLLGKYISSNVKYAEAYFDILCRAVQDNGVSVRKRAIKTLWDCCVRCPGFSRATEAVVAILHRVVDQEESMKSFVTKICSQLWFNPAPVTDAGSSDGPIERSPAQRASELARVALMSYEAGGRAIHVPLASDHPLVVVLGEALGEKVPAGARDVAEALLEEALALQDGTSNADSTSAGGVFPYLLSLHALSAAQPTLCTPESDPARFVRCLAPYLTAAAPKASDKARGPDEQRRAAEETLCLMCIIGALAGTLRHLDADLAEQIMKDLAGLISTHAFMQVIAGACQCLCKLAALQPALGAKQVSQLLTKCLRMVERGLPQPESPDRPAGQCAPPDPTHAPYVPRLLFLLGQLCRYGAAIIDAAAAAAASPPSSSSTPATPTAQAPPPSTQRLCALFIHAFRAPGTNPKVPDAALGALGMLLVAKPELMNESEDALAILSEALGHQAPVLLRTRALSNLVELLRAEEEGMVAKQQAAEAAAEAKQVASTLVRSDSKSLAKQNGEGDGSSLTSAILQRMWDRVLSIATDVSAPNRQTLDTPPKTPSATNGHSDAAAGMRRRALEVIEATLRGGIVAPWTAIPSLIALLTDANADTKARALRVLKAAIDKYPDYVAGQLSPAGITSAYHFQRRQWAAAHPGQPLPKAPSGDALHGLAAMYAEVVQPDAKLRTRFLSSLLKPFDEASCLVGPGAAIADVHALAFCAYAAAALPCKRGDEPLTLLHAINGVVSRHGHDVLDRLRKGLRAAGLGRRLADADDASGDEDAGAAAAGGDGVQVDGAAVNGAAVNGAANGGGVAGHLSGPLRASLALSMLLVLKQWLVAAYGLSNERVAAFELKGERRRAEEKAMVARSAKVPEFGLAVVNLRVLEDATGALLVEQYKVVSGLMDNDAANYRQAAVSAQLNGMDGGDDGTADAHHAATPAAGLVVFQTAKKPPRTGASTGRGKRGRSTAGKAASSSKHGSTAKRKHVARRVQMSDEDSEQDGED